MKRSYWLAALAAVGMLGGCSTLGTLGQARDTLAQAKAAGAEAKAPYEFYKAQAFLDLAEHEKDENDWSSAKEWAGVALENAQKALAQSKGGAQ